MKKFWMVLALLICFTAVASAQVSSPMSVYAGGALSVPAGGDFFKNAFKTGYHGWVGVGMSTAPRMSLIGKIEYTSFSSEAAGLLGTTGGTEKILMFGVDGKFSLGLPAAPIKPFLFGGLGMANVKQDDFSNSNSLITSALNTTVIESETKFYFNVGAGLDLFSGPAFSIFAQAKYVSIATTGASTQFIPFSIGARFF